MRQVWNEIHIMRQVWKEIHIMRQMWKEIHIMRQVWNGIHIIRQVSHKIGMTSDKLNEQSPNRAYKFFLFFFQSDKYKSHCLRNLILTLVTETW